MSVNKRLFLPFLKALQETFSQQDCFEKTYALMYLRHLFLFHTSPPLLSDTRFEGVGDILATIEDI